MIHTDSDTDSRLQLALALFFLVFLVVGVADLILDRPASVFTFHVALELLMVALSLGAVAFLGRGWLRAQSRLSASREESERLKRERLAWEERAAELLAGLGEAISIQFEEWGLTPAERRVALMVLKGLSHKRIARLTETSERTVRQHAVAVYRKAGLAGRAELAGFFLEALLLPDSDTTKAVR